VSAHFDELMQQLQQRCMGMAALVRETVETAANAVLSRDVTLGEKVRELEARTDAQEVEIEKQAISLLLLHAPAASDFRTVFGVVKINGDLERIADCALNICQQVPRFASSPVDTPRAIRDLAEATLKQVDDTVRCLATRDATLAEQICRADDLVDALNSQIIQELQLGMAKDAAAIAPDLALIMVSKNFERIGDHCNNIAEDVVYLMRGQIVRHAHEGPKAS